MGYLSSASKSALKKRNFFHRYFKIFKMAENIPFAGGHISSPKRKIVIKHGMVLDAIFINENFIGVRDAGNPVEILLEENEEVIKATYGKGLYGDNCITNLRLFTNLGSRILGPFGGLNRQSLDYYSQSLQTAYEGEFEACFTTNWLASIQIGSHGRPIGFNGEQRIGLPRNDSGEAAATGIIGGSSRKLTIRSGMIVDYIEYGPKNIGNSSGGNKQELMLGPMEKLHSATYKKRLFGRDLCIFNLKIQTKNSKTNEIKSYGPFGWPDANQEAVTFSVTFPANWCSSWKESPNSGFLTGFENEKKIPSPANNGQSRSGGQVHFRMNFGQKQNQPIARPRRGG